jgi:guanidinoacetate N-methyltransferase
MNTIKSTHHSASVSPAIDTNQTRIEIGFPTKEGWVESPALYTKDALRIAGHPVMEAWETGYMTMLADISTRGGGKVLEVGYGMGISARAIQATRRASSHVVIEAHPGVAQRMLADFSAKIEQRHIHLLTGFWQDITPLLADETFDGILFDTYPLSQEEIHANHFWFFKEAYRLLKPGGILTYYSDEVNDFSAKHLAKLHEAGFNDIAGQVCDVRPPKDCEYWQHNTILAPIVRKPAAV